MDNDNVFQKPERKSSEYFDQLTLKMSHIKGWGIDADPENDPTYPIRHRFEVDQPGYPWPRPSQQQNAEGILQSNEHRHLTSIFGTSTPAAKASGAIRRYAFRFSESLYRHWLLLLLADRINVFEGLLDDIFHGKYPRCLHERGFNAAWKYNKKSVLIRAAIFAVVMVGLVALILD